MVTLHDMLKDSSAGTASAGRAPASPPQQQQGTQGVKVDLRGCYAKIAMPAVAAAARYHSGSDARAADKPAGKSPQRS